MAIKNGDYIRSLPDFGVKIYEALLQIEQQHNTLAQQVNGNSTGQPMQPPSIDSVRVTGQNGHFHVAISDGNPIYRGIRYYAEYADNLHFTNAQTVPMGDARNHTIFLGNGSYYWRAFSAYISSPPGVPSYHGGAIPQVVSGGGPIGPPAFLAPQGTGTGQPGQALQGPGQIPFRSDTGVPPSR